MKILLLQDHLRSGGTERQSIAMTRAFQRAGHDASLLVFRPGGALASSANDLLPKVLQPFDTRLDWFAPGLLRCVRQASPGIVLCMGRMANCWAGFVQSTVRADRSPRVVATMRTGKPLPWLFRRSLKRVTHVVANSAESRDRLVRRYGVAAEQVSVIHNALVFSQAPEPAPGDRDAFRRAHGVGPDECVLLSVGMFRPEKNQRALVELAARLDTRARCHLWLAGDGPERAACERLAGRLGILDRTRFFGFQPDPTPLYRAADVAVLASRSESLSNFLIEAHAHGLPSIAYAAAGVTECGGRVVPLDDADAFLERLRALVEEPAYRLAEGARLAEYARAHFSPEKQAAAYLDLFERLLA